MASRSIDAGSSSAASSSGYQPTTTDSTEMASCSIDAGAGSSGRAESSSSGLGKAAIFLSYSGQVKPFVEDLYDALRKVNHEPFFDMQSLPIGAPILMHIKAAASQCTLGVVVLSDRYFTSKWCMLQLEILVNQRGENAKLLPLFYKTTAMDLKSPMKRALWQKKWEKKLHQEPKVVKKWGKAVNALLAFNGEIYERETSVIQYVNRVVKSICKLLLACPLPYNVSEIQGHSRLAQEVVQRFELVRRARRQDTKACMVGLYGVGGVGKSTVCKVLVNFFWSDYLGKAHHLEFPTKELATNISNMEHSIVQKCKKMLKSLTGVDEKLLSQVEEIDQVVALMKKHLVKHDVFLAIDNVRDSSQEIAGRILNVGFSPKSKIVVMSCCGKVLKDLIQGRENHVVPLPPLERDEAFQIFQNACALGDLNSLVREKHLLNGALERCKFHGSYHALALKALGLHVKKAYERRDLQDLSRILTEIKSIVLPKGFLDVIKLSYDSLEEQLKRMFLDIVVLLLLQNLYSELTVEEACEWLSILYKGQLPKRDVATNLNTTIYDLDLGGLLQCETNKCGEQILRVHDLLCDLAVKEVASSYSGRAVQEIQWQKLERVFVDEFCEPQFIEQLQWQECQKLRILEARKVGFLEEIDLRLMPALCVLKLDDVSVRSITNGPAALAVLVLHHVEESKSMEEVEEVGGLSSSVEEGDMRKGRLWERAIDFCGLAHLMKLKIFERERVERSPCALTRQVTLELPDMSQLTCLEILEICDCKFLERIGDLTALTRLDSLILKRNRSMKEVGCLSSNLRCVEISGCGVLKRLPDMSGLTRLEELTISDCGSLERIPDLSDLAFLDSLTLQSNGSMEKVDGLSSNLSRLRIEECGALEVLPDISGLTGLEVLEIRHCRSLAEVGDLSSNSNLRHVSIW